MISEAENVKSRDNVIANWKLGPEKASVLPTDNKDYWVMMANIWQVQEADARAMLCANCEYYDNSKEMQLEMNSIPLDKFDMDGGGRGFCDKFEFICHNLRTCQAWEDASMMDDMEEEVMKHYINTTVKGLMNGKS
jgi:hypothetical protein